MFQAHLIDHLNTALRLAELSGRPFVAYLIRMARDAAATSKTKRQSKPVRPPQVDGKQSVVGTVRNLDQ